MDIPPAIEANLEAMTRRKGLSPALTAQLRSLALSIMRAFADTPANTAELAKAFDKIGKCLTLEQADSPGSNGSESPLAGELRHLTNLLENECVGPRVIAVARTAQASLPAAPPRVADPPSPMVVAPLIAPAPERSALPEFRPRAPAKRGPISPVAVETPPAQKRKPQQRELPRAASPTPAASARMVAGLVDLHRTRLAHLDDDAATPADLARVERRLDQHIVALGWNAVAFDAGVEAAIREKDSERILGAAIGLVHLQQQSAPGTALELFRRLPSDRSINRPFVDALRLVDSEASTRLASRLLGAIGDDPSRAEVIPLLVERGCLPTNELVQLADMENDSVAAAAARALAWTGESAAAAAARDRLVGAATVANGERGEALLLASLARRGEESPTVMTEIRQRVDDGAAGVDAIDALAVTGDESDIERLRVFAAREDTSPALASRAKAAVAHLLGGISERGVWSLARTLRRLDAEDLTLRALDWIALETVLNTGRPLPLVTLPGASGRRTLEALARLRSR